MLRNTVRLTFQVLFSISFQLHGKNIMRVLETTQINAARGKEFLNVVCFKLPTVSSLSLSSLRVILYNLAYVYKSQRKCYCFRLLVFTLCIHVFSHLSCIEWKRRDELNRDTHTQSRKNMATVRELWRSTIEQTEEKMKMRMKKRRQQTQENRIIVFLFTWLVDRMRDA